MVYNFLNINYSFFLHISFTFSLPPSLYLFLSLSPYFFRSFHVVTHIILWRTLSLESIKSWISRQNASIGKVTGRCVDWKMKFCYYTNRCVINRTSAFLVIHDYRCIVNHRKLDRNFQIIVQFVYNFIARVFPLYFIKNSKFFIIKLGFFFIFFI